MSNILNHNRLPLECKLSYKDYWDFCLRIGREYYGFPVGMQTECLAAYIDTTKPECINDDNSLVSVGDYVYDKCISNGVILENFGLTGMDNGRVQFNADMEPEDFEHNMKSSLEIQSGDCSLHVYPVSGGNKHNIDGVDTFYSYGNRIIELNGVTCSELTGGFYQGFFKTGNGCDYSILPSDIGNGLSLEFELLRKDLEHEGTNLNDVFGNKGVFFYIGARAENKWLRYYNDSCSETENKPETTDIETSNGVQMDEYIPELTESDNKFLIYSRACGGTTVLNDKPNETVLVDTTAVEYDDNLFTVFSRKCGGITTQNFKEKYLKNHLTDKYDVYSDLWNNALGFIITDDNRVGYKYLVKDCDAENPSCAYKIESEYSYAGTVPYEEWVTIHVRVLPIGETLMRLMFYVNGRLVLYSKELPKLNLRGLKDLSEKQEGVPFNISIGGGTQGLCDVVYEDYQRFHQTRYPVLENEFGGSFIGYMKAFRFYSCSLNYNQINQNISTVMITPIEDKIYCGAIIFNTKPSVTPITEQTDIIRMLNEYSSDTKHIEIRLLPDLTKKYTRLVIATPSSINAELEHVSQTITGLGESTGLSDITPLFNKIDCMPLYEGGNDYDIWYCTYGSYTMSNNTVTFELR